MAEKTPRQKKFEQPGNERIQSFAEVTHNYTEEQAVLEANRCIQCKKPLCVSGCPVNIQIPQFIKKIAEKDFLGAYQTIKKDNDLPAVCGRVCPQETQCEGNCILGKKGEPVAIGNLERFVADYVRIHEQDTVKTCVDKKTKKVAIIGSGPAGLACAGELIAQGYPVTVFEALHELGGVLVYGIPEFRLPKNIVRHEIQMLEKAGVKFKKNQVIGKIKTIDELLTIHGFSAVFVGSGAGFPSFMNIPGEELNGIYSANEYLTRVNLMRAYQDNVDTPIKKAKQVIVVGGGNVAMDAARCARRLGAEVSLVYRRSKEEMPARIEEVHHAEEEGIQFLLLNNPVRFIGDVQGNVVSAEIQKMELGEPDASGRRRPVAVAGSEYLLTTDAIVIAVGTQANPIIKDTTPDLDTNKWGYITANDNGKTSKDYVYAGGDIVSGAATVILAMGAGKKAAQAIAQQLS